MSWNSQRPSYVRELARSLVKTQALKFGVFTLTSGKMSSYYIDLRLVPSYPTIFKKIVGMYKDVIMNHVKLSSFDAICGIPTSGLVFATAIALSLGKPLIYVRKEAKPHGTQRNIEGFVKPGGRVLLVDDLITTGTSLITSRELIAAEGCETTDAVVLVDREEGGVQNLEKVGVKLHSVAKVTELARELYDNNIISEGEYKAVLKQIGKT